MKNRLTKIALFGTSADPPSNGHRLIIQELTKIYNFVIVYASDNPSKKHKENLFFRSLLLKTLVADFKNPKIHFDQDLSSPWAIETIQKCQKKYNSKKIDFIIGSDLLNEIFSWKNIDKVLQEVNLFIIHRKGYPIETCNLESIKNLNGNYEISFFEIPNISSSDIRGNLNESNLSKSLLSIIKRHNLYKNSKEQY